MRRTLAAALLLALASSLQVRTSISTPKDEDAEGSGYDLNMSGYGSGDGFDQVSSLDVTNVMDRPGGKEWTVDRTLWPDRDVRSGYIIVSNSKSFLENKQIVAAIIAGGVTGVILAVILTAILIYRWPKKDNEGYNQGKQSYREEDD